MAPPKESEKFRVHERYSIPDFERELKMREECYKQFPYIQPKEFTFWGKVWLFITWRNNGGRER